jgi:uncharacterized protein YcbX
MSDGTVEALWRYPVKSMQGEQLDELMIETCGVSGDRRFALRDPSGKIGSGKSSRRFRRIGGLIGLRSWYDDGQPVVGLPSGKTVAGDDPLIDAVLSAVLDHDVTFVHDPEDPFVDAAPVHIVTTAALAWLRARLPATAIDERRFRPNLLIRAPDDRMVEDGWIGYTLRVGAEVELKVVDRTERCVMTNVAQPGLEHDAAVLRTIGSGNELCLGVYAEVVQPGTVRLGDPVTVQ